MSNNSINIGGNLIGVAASGNTESQISAKTDSANITQLPSSSDPEKPGIKELLLQLQEAIEAANELSSEDKADLQEQVQALAEAKQTPEPEKRESLTRKAKKIFDATLKGLPDTAKIVEACGKILPSILQLLGSSI